MDDLISKRSAVERLIIARTLLDSVLQDMPTSEPRKGEWIDGNEGKWNTAYCPKCSVCGTPFYGIEPVRYHYCPNCGARMEVEE